MRNPRKMRNSAVIVSLAAIATIVVGARFAERELKNTTPHTAWSLVAVAGATVAFFSLPLIVIRQFQMMPQYQLARGERVRARWTVSPEQWRQFQRLSREWDKTPNRGVNEIDVNQDPRSTGVEVIVGEYGLQVGGDFHGVGTTDGAHINESWIEIHKWLATDEPGGRVLHYRWPFPPEAKAAIAEFSKRRVS
jgi:hypothetical protein